MKTLAFSSALLRTGSFTLLAAILLAASFTSCSDQVEVTHRYTFMKPVYTTTAEIRNSFEILPSQPMTSTGKIYYRAPYLFVNQPGEGVHVINNSDPMNPVNERFIKIPGNFDMAVQGTILYADSYVNLLAINISDVNDVKITKRVESAFPLYNSWSWGMASWDENLGILTSWEEEEAVEVLDGALTSFAPGLFQYQGRFVTNEAVFFSTALSNRASVSDSRSVSPNSSTAEGVGGSMARFAIADQRLYTVDDANLQVFSVVTPEDPVAVGTELVMNFGIETIFPFKDKLFIGSQTGMFIYDTSDPDNPVLLSEFTHATSCDPVVANDTHAYVTLRSGNACQGFVNQLDVINIRDVTNPQLIESYAMENPHGLAISGTTLFVCEGEFGLKVFDASDSRAIDRNQLAHFKDIHAYDVIPLDNVLMVIGEDGLYQYDYSDPTNIQQLSKLTITPATAR